MKNRIFPINCDLVLVVVTCLSTTLSANALQNEILDLYGLIKEAVAKSDETSFWSETCFLQKYDAKYNATYYYKENDRRGHHLEKRAFYKNRGRDTGNSIVVIPKAFDHHMPGLEDDMFVVLVKSKYSRERRDMWYYGTLATVIRSEATPKIELDEWRSPMSPHSSYKVDKVKGADRNIDYQTIDFSMKSLSELDMSVKILCSIASCPCRKRCHCTGCSVIPFVSFLESKNVRDNLDARHLRLLSSPDTNSKGSSISNFTYGISKVPGSSTSRLTEILGIKRKKRGYSPKFSGSVGQRLGSFKTVANALSSKGEALARTISKDAKQSAESISKGVASSAQSYSFGGGNAKSTSFSSGDTFGRAFSFSSNGGSATSESVNVGFGKAESISVSSGGGSSFSESSSSGNKGETLSVASADSKGNAVATSRVILGSSASSGKSVAFSDGGNINVASFSDLSFDSQEHEVKKFDISGPDDLFEKLDDFFQTQFKFDVKKDKPNTKKTSRGRECSMNGSCKQQLCDDASFYEVFSRFDKGISAYYQSLVDEYQEKFQHFSNLSKEALSKPFENARLRGPYSNFEYPGACVGINFTYFVDTSIYQLNSRNVQPLNTLYSNAIYMAKRMGTSARRSCFSEKGDEFIGHGPCCGQDGSTPSPFEGILKALNLQCDKYISRQLNKFMTRGNIITAKDVNVFEINRNFPLLQKPKLTASETENLRSVVLIVFLDQALHLSNFEFSKDYSGEKISYSIKVLTALVTKAVAFANQEGKFHTLKIFKLLLNLIELSMIDKVIDLYFHEHVLNCKEEDVDGVNNDFRVLTALVQFIRFGTRNLNNPTINPTKFFWEYYSTVHPNLENLNECMRPKPS